MAIVFEGEGSDRLSLNDTVLGFNNGTAGG
jgi:hypothetical protein